MDKGRPLARMIAVQVKATESSRYASEDDSDFNYMVRPEDLAYWRPSNLPVIIVLYRKSDESFFWKQVNVTELSEERRLKFDKQLDVLDANAVDRLAALTAPKAGFGCYVPPLGGGEEALVNILPVTLLKEMFVFSTAYTPKKATSILLNADKPARFDWVIKDGWRRDNQERQESPADNRIIWIFVVRRKGSKKYLKYAPVLTAM